ncbi:MAG: ABC transporter ATP-binding protein [Actinomycetota bacterium]
MTRSDLDLTGDWAIRLDRVGKRYALGEREQYLALRDVIASAAGRLRPSQLRRRNGPTESGRPHRWALENVSFDVAPGEVVGLVGRNGAGKSTLLRLVSSITRPTAGSVAVRGRVGTLLEVGSGFHPELTGTENIFLNGAILGMRREEIRRNFDEIVEFSGVAEHLGTPVKRYSTGMYMRLAFAVAAHLDTEVLLVDEVLAVGDAEFQRKCIGRMRELADSQGRTVVFVSHNDAAIRQLCSRSVWLRDGSVAGDGPTDDVLPAYLEEQFSQSRLGGWIDVSDAARTGSGEARFTSVRLDVPGRSDARTVRPGEPLRVTVRVHADHDVACGNVSFHLATLGGMKLVSGGTGPDDPEFTLPAGETEFEIEVEALALNPGRYTGSFWLARPTGARRKFGLYDHVEAVIDVVVATPGGDDAEDALVATRSTLRLPSAVSTRLPSVPSNED